MNAQELTRTFNGRWYGRYGMLKCLCHDDHTPSFQISDDPSKSGGIFLWCHAGCDWRDVKNELNRRGLAADIKPTPVRVRKSDAASRSEYALSLWAQAVPLPGTLGEQYFIEQRGLDIRKLGCLSHALRFHPDIGVVALMTDAVVNKPTGIHRIFLNPDGSKRGDRKMLGPRGVIRLSPDEDVTQGLGITEGVEDGIAVLLSGWAPVWPATCADGIKKFPVLPGIEALTIFADSDVGGMEAARSCAEAWRVSGCDVVVQRFST